MSKADDQAVREYLEAVRSISGMRQIVGAGGVSIADLDALIASIQDKAMTTPDVLERVQLISQRRQLEQSAHLFTAWPQLEDAFIKHAATWNADHQIEPGTWREFGVSASVLRAAGIHSIGARLNPVKRTERKRRDPSPLYCDDPNSQFNGLWRTSFSPSAESTAIVRQALDLPRIKAWRRLLPEAVEQVGDVWPQQTTLELVKTGHTAQDASIIVGLKEAQAQHLMSIGRLLPDPQSGMPIHPVSLAKRYALALAVEQVS